MISNGELPASGWLDNRYRILRRLGAGGVGVVYEARHEEMDRSAAIKVLRGDVVRGPRAFERFRNEARAAGRLKHPHVVTVYDFGRTEAGEAFLVMEYCEGGSLAEQLLARGALPADAMVALLADVGDALDAAHGAGIVHRDLKPANILFSSGLVKVADFGLARMIGHGDDGGGIVLGSPHYMSPEQCAGVPADGRSDVYSLGIIAFEALTGTVPFEGEDLQTVVDAHLRQRPVSLRERRPDLPEAAAEAVARALDRDRDARFDTASAFADALRRALSGSTSAGRVPRGLSARPRTELDLTGPVALDHTVADPIGRAEEMRRLAGALASARAGRGRLLTIAGEPGRGKTTLVAAFTAAVGRRHADVVTVVGRCSEHFGAGEAYRPLLDALGGLRARDDTGQVETLLATLAPTWWRELRVGAVEAGDEGAPGRSRMARELAELLGPITAARPLVIVLEDLHWADTATIDALVSLLPRLGAFRLLVVGTYRPADIEATRHPLRAALRAFARTRGTWSEIAPTLFSEPEVAEYLRRETGAEVPRATARFVHRRTEGNPLFVANVAAHLASAGALGLPTGPALDAALASLEESVPGGVLGVIAEKIERLAEADRRLLQAASVAGDTFEARLVAALVDRDEVEVEEKLDALHRVHRLVVPVGELHFPSGAATLRYRFTHSLYQNALYATLSPRRAATWHTRLAEEMLVLYGGHEGPVAIPLAVHFEKGRDFARALAYRLAAAEAAARLGLRQARPHLERALQLADEVPAAGRRAARADVLVRLARLDAEMAEIVGDVSLYERAEASVSQALVLAPESIEARTILGLVRLERGENERALHSFAQVLASSPRHAPAWDGIAYLFKNTGLWAKSLRAAERAAALDPASYGHSIRRLSIFIYQGRFEDARAEAEALQSARPRYSHYAYWRGITEYYAGDHEKAREWIERGHRIDPEDQIAQGVLAFIRAAEGRAEEAEPLLHAAEEGAGADGTFTYWIAKVHALLDRPAEAVEWIARAERLGYWNAPWMARDPALARLHGDPAFAERLRSMTERHRQFAALVTEGAALFDA